MGVILALYWDNGKDNGNYCSRKGVQCLKVQVQK